MRTPTARELALFQRLAGPASPAEVDDLRAAVLRHLEQIRQAARQHELLPVDLAEDLAGRIDDLLVSLDRLPAEARPLVIGVARYFVSDDDAIPDQGSVLGLDDDLAVFNDIVRRIGRGELEIADE